jgi:alpha-methylacyl-CoA racemase
VTVGPGATPADRTDSADPAGPLAGVRVVELGGIGPTPFAGLYLAELGADVVRVDRPGESNPLAVAGGLRRSRPSIAVDLKHEDGRAVVRRLVDDSDVLLEGYRPGVAERLGLGPEECLARNPRLVHARMTGWGQTGPWAQRAGHDITYAAVSGTLHALGTADRPVTPPPVIGDFAGGSMYLVVGVLAALVARGATGRGQVVDAAMVDGSAHLLTLVHGLLGEGAWRDERAVNLLDGGAPFYDVYECADGRFVAVGALEPAFWEALVAGLGIEVEGSQYDPSAWPAHREAFTAAFRTRDRDEWAAVFDGTDACVAPVLSLTEAPHHPHLAARGTFAAGPSGHPVPRTGPRLSVTPARDPGAEPVPGADTTAYLVAHGFSAAEVEALRASGAVVQA